LRFSPARAPAARALSDRERAALSTCIPERDLAHARLYDGRVPWYLPRRFTAITRGNRVYFRPGACRTDTADGLALLAHELVHVGQYRQGATWLTFLLSYLRHGYWSSPLEEQARAVANEVRRAAVESAEGPAAAYRNGISP
jgi:hypothetical protein